MLNINPAYLSLSEPVGDLQLSHVRLCDDARFPWLILIPRVEDALELEDLTAEQRALLIEEMVRCGPAVRAVAEALGRPAKKLNTGQLGNVAPYLHLHVVARRPEDACWPGPVWGYGEAERYGEAELATAIRVARDTLGL